MSDTNTENNKNSNLINVNQLFVFSMAYFMTSICIFYCLENINTTGYICATGNQIQGHIHYNHMKYQCQNSINIYFK